MEKTLNTLSLMLSDLFMVSLFLYLAAVRIDLSLEGLISRAFNPTILLLICLLSGIGATLCADPERADEQWRAPKRLWVYAVFLSALIGSIVYEALQALSPWALILSGAAAVIVFLASFAIIQSGSRPSSG
ncbi:hypothetical protein HY732_02005 [Candidatus Uhrbacteria bacterium]|nr:hypothetical protein [Candidatus Uhrbacteria bacterium]